MNLNFNDFQKQDIKFDVNKLQNAYKELLTIKGFSGVDGVSNFGAISLTQIPGDPDSIKGNKARGVFWTKPDSSFEEMEREPFIDETRYTLFNPKLNNTYFKYVYEKINEFFDPCT